MWCDFSHHGSFQTSKAEVGNCTYSEPLQALPRWASLRPWVLSISSGLEYFPTLGIYVAGIRGHEAVPWTLSANKIQNFQDEGSKAQGVVDQELGQTCLSQMVTTSLALSLCGRNFGVHQKEKAFAGRGENLMWWLDKA